MKGIYILSLSDSDGHYHLLATDINSEEEKIKLDTLMKRWYPVSTLNGEAKKIFLKEDIFESLKELTGYSFYVLEPDYSRKFSGKRFLLPWLH